MQSPTDAAAADPTKARSFSQVVFIDTPYSYPPSTPVTCCYTLSAALQPNPRDWVGIFKVGWSTTKDYHTFVWVEPCLDVVKHESATRQAAFKDYYLPKDEIDFYQFCYVDSSGQVRGASTPFCFKSAVEQSSESSPDDDLLVITTQEQVEQSVREKADLQKELKQIREENESLKNDLQKEQREAANLKGQNEQKEKEMSQLVKEMDEIKEQNGNLRSTLQKQAKEMDGLKEEALKVETLQQEATEEMTSSQTLSLESGQNEKHAQEKYERAVTKINQLKEERAELRGRVDAQSADISTLNSKLREQERELSKTKDGVQLLEVDLQSSEKEKERLSAELHRLRSLADNVDDVKRENQELSRRLSQQDAVQSRPDDDQRSQTLVRRLQDAEAKLADEREENRNAKRRAEFLDKELLQMREQLEKLSTSHEQAQRMSSKQEMQLREAHEAIADKDGIIEDKEQVIRLVRHENQELAAINQNLLRDIEGLRKVYADLHEAPPTESPHPQPDTTATTPETPEQAENLYENIGSAADEEEEQLLVCRYCQEVFPCITRKELEQHEQSHRLCPICMVVCDHMEQSVFEGHVYDHDL